METNLDHARECGATVGIRLAGAIGENTEHTMDFAASQLDAFAARIRADERERCALACEALTDVAERIKAQKRVAETCNANVDVQLAALRHELDVSLYNAGLKNCADAIRKAAP